MLLWVHDDVLPDNRKTFKCPIWQFLNQLVNLRQIYIGVIELDIKIFKLYSTNWSEQVAVAPDKVTTWEV